MEPSDGHRCDANIKRCHPYVAGLKAFCMTPIVAMLVTIAVRFMVFFFWGSIERYVAPALAHPTWDDLLPSSSDFNGSGSASAYYSTTGEKLRSSLGIQFSFISPSTGSFTWREVIYWRDTIRSPIPDYLLAVSPWYARHLPSVLARRPLTVMWLSLCDGLTAFIISRWPSCLMTLLYPLLVLNPATIYPVVCESLVSLEFLILTLVLETCRQRHRIRACGVFLALLFSAFAGSQFIALPVALLYPVGSTNRILALAAMVVLTIAIGMYALGYIYVTHNVYRNTSLFAPPDNGVLWYVRQLVLPSFDRCFEALRVQLPALLMVTVAMSVPRALNDRMGVDNNKEHGKLRRYESLFPDRKLMVTLLALCVSQLLRDEITVTYYCFTVLCIYSLLNTAATKVITKPTDVTNDASAGVITHSAYLRVRILLPAYILVLCIPLEIAFYVGWVLWETANANWIFFVQLGFVSAGAFFVALWVAEIADDLVMEEKAAGGEE